MKISKVMFITAIVFMLAVFILAVILANWLAVATGALAIIWWYVAWVLWDKAQESRERVQEMSWAMHTALRHADTPSQDGL